MEPLTRFHAIAHRVPDGPDQSLIFHDLPLFVEQHPAFAPLLSPVVQYLQRWPGRRGLDAVVVGPATIGSATCCLMMVGT